ncbi:MAG: DUF3696 domain-containing protein [Sedimentisphaerales bacterium]|nr:DUF3696 domain-containing protein [Sedimentisphaerales bacterium]
MIINNISLKNFKCFKDVELNFSRITLLTGANSSGKSSLLYGILAPFQSKDFPFYLSPNGKYVNMGDFADISFNNITENPIGIDISVRNIVSNKDLDYIILDRVYQFKTRWMIDNPNNNMPSLNYVKVTTFRNDFQKIEDRISNFEIKAENSSFLLNFQYYEGYDNEGRPLPSAAEFDDVYSNTQFNSLDELKKDFWDDNKLIKDLHRFSNQQGYLDEQKLNFISSFRLRPERTYYQKTKSDKVDAYGENYIDQIIEWENSNSKKFHELNSILRDLALLRSIKTKKLQGGRFELRAEVNSQGVSASLTDVGFGISQFLPIIVADLQLSRNSTLLLAQPEIHLHPSVQALLGNYFIKQTKEYDKHYIIETHSEYLLNRIRLAIVKGEIESFDVSVYYFENTIDGTKTYEIEFTENGEIKNAPQGFFDTYMMDVMDIALHA